MIENAILILLYNKEINESNTIKSIIDAQTKYNNAQIVIWNNGPTKLQDHNCSSLENLGYNVTIRETIDNQSLASIYNRFIDTCPAEKYIFLDDDSNLTSDYIFASSQISKVEVGMPIIKSQKSIHAPIVNMKPYQDNLILNPEDMVITIGSGLIIGKVVTQLLKREYQSVFDERFYLYGVDNTLCIRLYRAKLTKTIKIIAGFEHSLSRLENESIKTTKFRQIERSYSTGLELRHYHRFFDASMSICRTAIITIKNMIIGKKRSISFTQLLKAYVTGKHYRAR